MLAEEPPVVAVLGQEAGGEGPVNGYAAAAIDGKDNTFWHSQWSGGTGTPPHLLTIDMGKSLPIDGFIITQRQSLSRNIKNMVIETSSDGITWSAVVGSPFALTQTVPPQAKLLPGEVTTRYFRLRVETTSDVFDGYTNAALAEVNVSHRYLSFRDLEAKLFDLMIPVYRVILTKKINEYENK